MSTRLEESIIQTGQVEQDFFQPDCRRGDWQVAQVHFPQTFPTVPVVFPPSSTPETGFYMVARNSDCAEGSCGFYYVAVADGAGGATGIWVDSGMVHYTFQSNEDCHSGDWGSWLVHFSQPFSTAPVVLVNTTNIVSSGSDDGPERARPIDYDHNAALVGIAQDVTPHGFRLAARNSDCHSGSAGFYWIAFGCGVGCG